MSEHVYLGIENLAMSAAQKAQLVDALQKLGPSRDSQPANLCHWRVSLDNEAVIFEALFQDANISIGAIKARLAGIFEIPVESIAHAINIVTFADEETAIVTYSYNSTAYLRFAIFGYAGTDWPTWAQSGVGCRAYIKANIENWEAEV